MFALIFAFVMMTSLAYADVPGVSSTWNGRYVDIAPVVIALSDVTCDRCNYAIGNRNTEKDGWYYSTATKHEYRVYYYGVCFECGSACDIYQINGYGEHIWVYSSNKHMGTTLRHQVIYRCSMCYNEMYDYFDCHGPENGGCTIIINSVDDSAIE